VIGSYFAAEPVTDSPVEDRTLEPSRL